MNKRNTRINKQQRFRVYIRYQSRAQLERLFHQSEVKFELPDAAFTAEKDIQNTLYFNKKKIIKQQRNQINTNQQHKSNQINTNQQHKSIQINTNQQYKSSNTNQTTQINNQPKSIFLHQ
jgi:hypothetical protein